MKIGIVGAGSVGTALAKRLVPLGHDVMLSFSRDGHQLRDTAARFGATSGTPQEASLFGDVVALATPWNAVPEALRAAGALEGKVLWDCTNALKADMSGLAIGTTTSGAETIQRLVPQARVVKGIPPFAELLHADDPTIGGRPSGAFICSDDAEAKAIVWPLLAALPAEVVDAGPLENARYIEPAGFLLVRLAYGMQLGPRIGLGMVTE